MENRVIDQPTNRRRKLVALLPGACVVAAIASSCGEEAKVEAPPPEVVVATVGTRDVPVYGEWVGTIDGSINAQIRAKVQGYLISTDYQEGALVNANDVLFRLDDRPYKAALDAANAEVVRAEAILVRGEQNVTRYRPLVANGAVSQKELDDAIQSMKASAAGLDAARAALDDAKLNLEWTTVRAPITGIAGIARAQVGDLIAPTTLMTTVSQLDQVKVSFPISEREYLRFTARNAAEQRGPDDRPPIELILADDSVYKEQGKVSAVDREVAVQTGSLQIQAVFPNPDNLLRPGGYAKVRAATEMRKGAMIVPQRAVQEIQGSHQMAVVNADDTIEIRGVKMGPKSGTDWVVDQGLKPGDRVVVEGFQRLRNGMKIVAKPYAGPAAAAATNAPASAPEPKPEHE